MAAGSYFSRDVDLGRHVALKAAPRPEAPLTPELRSRFLREVRAAAALSHPGIVPVFEAGLIGPICYIASEYCAGPTLAEWIHAQSPSPGPSRGPGEGGGAPGPGEGGTPFRAAAEWMALLADAVEHAHERGVLHRDLKPGNILLVSQDETQSATSDIDVHADVSPQHLTPRITDFGLAKFETSDATATRTGSILGTVAYMAPEQAEGRRAAIDRRTDVYGLGTVLYELLTRQPAFREASDVATLMAVREREPVRPSRLRRDVPSDLEAICLACLEKRPAKRYATAGLLAADLRRYLSGEPTLVRPVGSIRRSAKWAARHRLLTALIAVVLLSSLLFMAGTAWHAHRLEQELAVSDEMRTRAEEREASYHELLYAADMRLAHRALMEKDMVRAVELLDAHIPAASEQDYRDVEWYFLRHRAVGEHVVVDEVETPTYDVAFSPDGSRCATVGQDAVLRSYDWPNAKRLGKIDTGQRECNGVEFSDDGTILTTGDDGTIKFWRDEKLVQTIKAHSGEAHGIVFSKPTNRWISHGDEPVIRMWSRIRANPWET